MQEPTELEEFQKTFGSEWRGIVSSPCFAAAFRLLHVQKVAELAFKSDEEIEKNSREILSDLRGWLKHEAAMITLHDKKIYKLDALPEETYN